MKKVTEEEFARDHWTCLVYAETRCVDYKGILSERHLRIDGKKYPTRLKTRAVTNHNDVSCFEDLDDAGYMHFSSGAFVCTLTDKGWEKAHSLRRERAERSLV